MKVKSFLLTALAASMTFVACDNKDDEMGQLDNTPKSVSIDLSNVIPVTRGAGQEVEDNSKVSLTDLQVFFTDGTTLYKGKTIEGTEATHYFSNKSNFDDRADKVFHFLPAEVNKVIVVGNNGSQINASTYVNLKKDLIIAEQQNPTDLDLYKEVELTSVSGQDEAGHPLYKAKVVLEPRVSRIEIGKFEYTAPTQGQRKYKSIEVQQVMLNNYFGKADRQGGTASDIQNSDINPGSIFGLFETAADAWYNDEFTSTESPATTLPLVTLDENTQYKHSYEKGNVRPAYHFFPKDNNIGNTNHPQVLVKLIGTTNEGTKVPLYLATSTFTPAVTADFAKIYVMNFAFSDEDLDNPQKCVEVTVDVMSWDVVPVTPEF